MFVGKAIVPAGVTTGVDSSGRREPSLPASFQYGDKTLAVGALRRTWRSSKDDRGDTYLKRHWFEFETPGGGVAVVYFDRATRRGTPHWYLYTLDDPTAG